MISYQPNPTAQPLQTRKSKFGYWLGAVIVVALVMGLYVFTNRKDLVRIGLMAMPFFLLAFRELYRRSRRSKIKKSRFSTKQPYSWEVEAHLPSDLIHFDNVFPEVIAALRKIPVPLLFLIDKRSKEDHQACLYDKYFESLTKEGIRVTRFFHKGDMQIFWKEDLKEHLSLEELAQKFKAYQPIFCGDAHRAIDPTKDELQAWTFHLYNWKQCILLTNRPVSVWDFQEKILETIFTLLPFSKEGLFSLSKILNKQSASINFPAQISSTPEEFLEDDPLLITKLENKFGKQITQWIAATALCSKLDWELTLQIGEYLSKKEGNLVSFNNMQAISQLAWFRDGIIPEEARQKLVDYLPENLQTEIRSLIVTTLEENPPATGSHAHNNYRMELAGLKALIPNFPQKGLKNELYELKSLGYREDILVTDWIDGQKWWIDRLIPKSLERLAYNEGAFLLGRSWQFFIPLLLIFSGLASVTPLPDIPEPKEGPITISFDNESTPPPPSMLKLDVWVENKEGDPIALASTEIHGAGYTNQESTDSQGAAHYKIDPKYNNEEFIVEVYKEGYKGPEQKIKLLTNRSVTVILNEVPDITIQPHTIIGKVIDVDGDYIARTRIRSSASSEDILSKAEGDFTLDLPDDFSAPSLSFSINKNNYLPLDQRIRISDEPVELILVPSKVVIVVVDGENRETRLKGATVKFLDQEKKTNNWGKVSITLPDDYDSDRTLALSINHKDYQPSSLQENISKEIEIPLYPSDVTTYSIKGEVTSKCTEEPIADVEVNIGEIEQSFTRSRDGRFELIFPYQGDDPLELRLTKSGYLLSSNIISVDKFNQFISIALKPTQIWGTVFNDKGNPMYGAEIFYENSLKVHSGRDGTFSFPMEKGAPCKPYIKVSMDDHEDFSNRFNNGGKIILETKVPVDVFLTGQLKGKVVDKCNQNSYVSNPKVSINGVNQTIRTTRRGQFESPFEYQDGKQKIEVTVSKDGYESVTREISIRNLNRTHSFKLPPKQVWGTLEEDGKAVSGATVIYGNYPGDTDRNGRFSISVPEVPDCNPSIKVYHNQKTRYTGPFENGGIVTLAPERREDVVITGQLKGKVVDKCNQNSYISNPKVSINGVNQTIRTIRRGQFESPFEYQDGTQKIEVTVSKDGYESVTREISIRNLNRTHSFKLPPKQVWGTLEEAGKPVSGATVIYGNYPGDTDRYGRFSISVPEVPDCNPSIEVYHNQKIRFTGPFENGGIVTLEPERREDVVITGQLKGKVVDKCNQNSYISNPKVSINGVNQTIRTIRRGQFESPFEYQDGTQKIEVTVSKDGYESVTREISIRNLNRTHSFKLPPKQVWGTLEEAGKPVSGATVIYGNYPGDTDRYGRFSISVPEVPDCNPSIEVYHNQKIRFTGPFENGGIVTLEPERREDVVITGRLKGRVTNKCFHSEAITNPKFTINGIDYSRRIGTKGQFDFTFKYKEDTPIKINASKDGYHKYSKELSTSQLDKYLTVELTPKKITGTVINEKKAGIYNASVIYNKRKRPVTTSRKGIFEIPLSKNDGCTFKVSVKAEGFKNFDTSFTHDDQIQLSPNKPSRLSPTRPPLLLRKTPKSITIRVFNALYEIPVPISNAEIFIDNQLKGKTNRQGELTTKVTTAIDKTFNVTVKKVKKFKDKRQVVTLKKSGQVVDILLEKADVKK